MGLDSRRQSIRAIVAVMAAVAILFGLRWLYQTQQQRGEAEAARAVVQHQLDAFRDGDYERAYSYAATGIQSQLPVAEFRKMVEEGYPHIAHVRETRFGKIRHQGPTVFVELHVTGSEGGPVPTVYALQRENGDYKVIGVASEPILDPTAPEREEPPSAPEEASSRDDASDERPTTDDQRPTTNDQQL